MTIDTQLTELIINTLSPEQMPERPSDTEIYLVEDDAEYATVEELATKQDVITDLDTIRAGASKGATALQSVPSNYVTNTQLATKQNLLTAGDNITIENDVISAKASGGLEVGDIGLSIFVDESKGLRRYLNGSIVAINTNTQAFLDRLKQVATLYPSIACTESEWQSIKTLSAFGQCGKFVIDEANGTIRLPRIVMPIQGLTDLTKLGEIVEQGLPNIQGVFYGANASLANGSGAFKDGSNMYGATVSSGFVNNQMIFDASRSSSIYKDGSNVQQEQIQYPYFIQIATGQETQVDIVNEIELNNPYSLGESKYSPNELDNVSWLPSNGQWNSGSVHVDFYNAYVGKIGQPFGNGLVKASTDTYSDYDLVINTADRTFRLPLLDGSEDLVSDRYDNLTLQASETDYTAPANGWFYIDNIVNNGGYTTLGAIINNNWTYASQQLAHINNQHLEYILPIKKGDKCRVLHYNVISTQSFRFIYAKGNGTLYYYVGETVQNANLIDVGRIAEQLTNKVDINSSWGMPSNRYVDLTLGASGTTYTAPANGYYFVNKKVNAVNQYFWLQNNTNNIALNSVATGANDNCLVLLPVKKGDIMQVIYTAGGTLYRFRFYYAKGSN